MKPDVIVPAKITLPSFGRSTERPEIPVTVYLARWQGTLERMRQASLDALVLYADREHSANVAYLTGFDPRFEEALLLISSDGRRKLLVGNECMGYLPQTQALNLEVELFQELSLLGQPRNASRPLRTILREFGIGPRRRVGCASWKTFQMTLLGGPLPPLDIPAYLADALRELVKDRSRVVNATAIFMDVQDGLRVTNEPVQIAQFEDAACVASEGILKLLRHLRPGVAEQALEKYLDARGLPLSCHRMIGFGTKAARGLASPSATRARLGEAFTTAFGVQGALSCRAGILARDAADAPSELREFYSRFTSNYFRVVAAWYENVRVGAKADRVVRAVERARDKSLFRLALNPGHYLHLDEWLHSPFTLGSPVTLRSGMMLQMDIIPVSLGPFCCANAEDGVALGDASFRAQLSDHYPSTWKRIVARREFMRQALGIRLDDSVLPLSNMPGWFPPYALGLETAFRME